MAGKEKDEQAILAPDAPSMVGLTPDQLAYLAKLMRGDDDERMRKQAQYDAEAHQRVTNPSREDGPQKSVYSYPEGDYVRPRPDLKCEMFWMGHPIRQDTAEAEMLELCNRMEPGEYLITKMDGSQAKLTVEGQRDVGGKLTRLLFTFPCLSRDNKNTWPSDVAMLRQALGLAGDMNALHAEILRLKQQLQEANA